MPCLHMLKLVVTQWIQDCRILSTDSESFVIVQLSNTAKGLRRLVCYGIVLQLGNCPSMFEINSIICL